MNFVSKPNPGNGNYRSNSSSASPLSPSPPRVTDVDTLARTHAAATTHTRLQWGEGEEGRGGVIQRPTVKSTSCTRPRFVSAWKSMHCFASISFFRGSVERRRHRRRRFFSLPTTSSKKGRCRQRAKRRFLTISVLTLIVQKCFYLALPICLYDKFK